MKEQIDDFQKWELDPMYHVHVKMYCFSFLTLRVVTDTQVSPVIAKLPNSDRPIRQVHILGTIVHLESKRKFTVIKVDDGSGVVTCTVWPGGQHGFHLELGQIVSVYGFIRFYNDMVEINVRKIFLTTDPGEELLWWLEVAHCFKSEYLLPFRDQPSKIDTVQEKNCSNRKKEDDQNSSMEKLRLKILEYAVGASNVQRVYSWKRLRDSDMLFEDAIEILSKYGHDIPQNRESRATYVYMMYQKANAQLLKEGYIYQKPKANKDEFSLSTDDDISRVSCSHSQGFQIFHSILSYLGNFSRSMEHERGSLHETSIYDYVCKNFKNALIPMKRVQDVLQVLVENGIVYEYDPLCYKINQPSLH